ncbi:MAG: saccharopine dehydrogenase family protein [Halovenus sp.]
MSVLIYGAYGYTGELIAREAVDRDLDVVLAGRNGTKTRGLGAMLDADTRVFEADDAAAHLDGIDIVLNCAGPFVRTYGPIVDACLATGTHYLDITGEFPVFEDLAGRDREAEKAGCMLLPGIGFDVVPTDCVAGHLHDRHPEATELRLGIDALGAISGGTAASVLELAGDGGKIRRDGKLVEVPVASGRRTIDFGEGPRNAVRIPWGDVSTAYYTTGIENIEVYAPMPDSVARALRMSAPATALLDIEPIKDGLQWVARTVATGPSKRQRERGRALIWGEASDGERTVTTRLRTPEPYALTVDAATTAVARLDEMGEAPIGYQTPASAFDADFVLELDGVEGFFDEDEAA